MASHWPSRNSAPGPSICRSRASVGSFCIPPATVRQNAKARKQNIVDSRVAWVGGDRWLGLARVIAAGTANGSGTLTFQGRERNCLRGPAEGHCRDLLPFGRRERESSPSLRRCASLMNVAVEALVTATSSPEDSHRRPWLSGAARGYPRSAHPRLWQAQPQSWR